MAGGGAVTASRLTGEDYDALNRELNCIHFDRSRTFRGHTGTSRNLPTLAEFEISFPPAGLWELGMRILLVEDEPKVAGFVERGLVAERYAVDVSGDGREAWELAEAYPYDLIILDLMLPGLDGSEILQRIRKKNTCVPVLVLTARDAVDDKVRLFEMGADDYLTKPFAFAELLVRSKALLRRGPVNRSSTLRVGDLELDRLTQQVKRKGHRIELTTKEYQLLEYLMQNPGRVLSRNMIIEHVWDQSFDGFTNIVDVYVRHLRGKVDDDHEFKMIRTVRGTGYMIRSESES
jgi:DNA-binding response OmpR family regulator